MTLSGAPASSTDPGTWSWYRAVRRSGVGDGYGVMLGGGLACLDLDHCFDDRGRLAGWARVEVEKIAAPLWVERSLSGDGLHVFYEAPEAPGTRRGGVEVYSRARFIAVTGDRFVP